jgi:hypothetical protein
MYTIEMCMTLYTVESGIEMTFSKQEDLGIRINLQVAMRCSEW